MPSEEALPQSQIEGGRVTGVLTGLVEEFEFVEEFIEERSDFVMTFMVEPGIFDSSLNELHLVSVVSSLNAFHVNRLETLIVPLSNAWVLVVAKKVLRRSADHRRGTGRRVGLGLPADAADAGHPASGARQR